jgi:hypothetical protein
MAEPSQAAFDIRLRYLILSQGLAALSAGIESELLPGANKLQIAVPNGGKSRTLACSTENNFPN